jgi:hypothetical protein
MVSSTSQKGKESFILKLKFLQKLILKYKLQSKQLEKDIDRY